MIPIEIVHSVTIKASNKNKKVVYGFIWNFSPLGLILYVHLSCVDQRHVGQGHHVAMTSESDSKNSLHVGLVEAWENSSGVRWLHLGHGHVPE
jgi:hypothetical protein